MVDSCAIITGEGSVNVISKKNVAHAPGIRK